MIRPFYPKFTYLHLLAYLIVTSVLFSCSQTVVKGKRTAFLEVENQYLSDDQLLDVGIVVFNPGLEKLSKKKQALVYPEVRKAESHYMAVQLMETLQKTAAWGAVRVVPNSDIAMDITVTGTIIESDGEKLHIAINAVDSFGNLWLKKKYEQYASRYSYTKKNQFKNDPFSNLYAQIANDLLNHRKSLGNDQVASIKQVSELRFAQSFSPETFNRHLQKADNGKYVINQLPAENDTMMTRIRKIRERDYLFVDTMQGHYDAFVNEMAPAYREWRGQSYDEAIAVRDLKNKSRNRTLAGVASVIGGILAAGSSSGSSAAAGQIAIAGGGYLIKDGFDKRSESKMHIEALQELGASLEADIEESAITLEDRTITLTGSVESQYNQWKKMLKAFYQAEVGEAL